MYNVLQQTKKRHGITLHKSGVLTLDGERDADRFDGYGVPFNSYYKLCLIKALIYATIQPY